MKRIIEYLTLPTYWAQIESSQDHRLKNRPFVISDLFFDKQVLDVSIEAKKEGVIPGMSLAEAKSICPKLKSISPRYELYDLIFERLLEHLLKRYPLIEPHKNKGLFIDYSGLEGVYGDSETQARSLQREVKSQFSLDCRFGLSETKFVSQLASTEEAGEEDILKIHRQEVKSFLAPWPVEILPGIKDGLSSDGYHQVCLDLNLKKISDVQSLPKEFFTLAFGQERGELIYACAMGKDFRKIVLPKKEQSIQELVSFKPETNDRVIILEKIKAVVLALEATLIESRRFADSCVLIIRYSDLSKKEFLLNLKSNNSIYKELSIFVQKLLGQRRLAIRDILIRLSGLELVATQLHLFDPVLERQKLKKFLYSPPVQSNSIKQKIKKIS